MDQFNNHEPWTVVKGAQIEGGHAIIAGTYNMVSASDMETEIGTWGAEQDVADAWWMKYVEEAWIVVTEDWMATNGTTAEGFNWDELEADFQTLTGAAPFPEPGPSPSPTPSPDPTPTPVPDPTPTPTPQPQPEPVGWDNFVDEAEAWLTGHHVGANATFARHLKKFIKANQD
jgi:hypothetical protein